MNYELVQNHMGNLPEVGLKSCIASLMTQYAFSIIFAISPITQVPVRDQDVVNRCRMVLLGVGCHKESLVRPGSSFLLLGVCTLASVPIQELPQSFWDHDAMSILEMHVFLGLIAFGASPELGHSRRA